MKKILIKEAKLLAEGTGHHLQRRDVLVENGKISRIGKIEADGSEELIEGNNLYLSAGWVDLRVNYWDPGFEYREDLKTGTEASAFGGFTGVGLMPETEPYLNTKSLVEYVKVKTAGKPVDVYPLAGVNKDNDFNELSEMYDLADAGALAFSSGSHAMPGSGFLVRAMMYSRNLDRPLMLLPENKGIVGKGQMNEGLINVQLGLKGIPALAEEVEVANAIAIGKYAGSKIHLAGITSEKSLMLLDDAVNAGLHITADVSIHHLQFSDDDLMEFNTNLKLKPPVRSIQDRKALRQALLEKEYLTVTSGHMPQEEDRKKCEFELAAYGAIGTQTLFSQLREIYGREEEWQKALKALIVRSRKILSLEVPQIKEGAPANMTIFDPDIRWIFDDKTNKSKSKNSPVWQRELNGRAMAILNKGIMKRIS